MVIPILPDLHLLNADQPENNADNSRLFAGLTNEMGKVCTVFDRL